MGVRRPFGAADPARVFPTLFIPAPAPPAEVFLCPGAPFASIKKGFYRDLEGVRGVVANRAKTGGGGVSNPARAFLEGV